MAWSGGGSFSRSNGTHTGATTWQQDEAAGTGIVADRHDTHDQDLALGINACLAKNGENAATANLPMGGFKHTNVAVASARTDYARASQVQDSSLTWLGSAGGTANALTASASPAITAYAAGQMFAFRPSATNTSTATININGVGAANIQKGDGSVNLGPSDLLNGRIHVIQYDGSNFILLNPNVPVYGTTLYAAGAVLAAPTSDGSDNTGLIIAGGGASSTARGAFVRVYGNEASSAEGFAEISAGDTASGNSSIRFATPGANGVVEILQGGNSRWVFQADGDLAQNGTNGGNLLFSKNETGVAVTVDDSEFAAGTTQGTATALVTTATRVTSSIAASADGVRLSGNIPVGGMQMVRNDNSGADPVKVYPPTGAAINRKSTNVHVSLAAGEGTIFVRVSSTQWISCGGSVS